MRQDGLLKTRRFVFFLHEWDRSSVRFIPVTEIEGISLLLPRILLEERRNTTVRHNGMTKIYPLSLYKRRGSRTGNTSAQAVEKNQLVKSPGKRWCAKFDFPFRST